MATAYGFSHPGKVRKMNEDNWRSDHELGLFVVADGMGGHNAGDVASEMAVEAICGFMRRTQDGEDVTWPFGIDPKLSFHANRVRTAIQLANRRVFKSAETRDEYTGMGTTVTMLYLDAKDLVCGSVGDSRLYAMTDGELSQVTTDDSWVQTIQDAKADAGDLARHRMRHVLTKVVGVQPQVDVQIVERRPTAGQTLLLCSDGLHGELTDQEIGEILGSSEDPKAIVDRLVETVLTRPARDNLTAIVVRT